MIESLPEEQSDEYLKDVCMDEHFGVLKLACSRVGQPKLVQTGLMVIEKFVSCDLLVGLGILDEIVGVEDRRRVIDVIVETVCIVRDDEETQLLVIRAVLSLVLNRNVHGISLMTCVRTLFGINKDSRSVTAQATAVAALTQMLNSVITGLDGQSRPFPAEVYSRALLNKTVLISDPDNLQNDHRGKHGWCVVCGKRAEFFCLSNRVPVCKFECKRVYSRWYMDPPLYTTGYKDVLTVFNSLCKLAGGGAVVSSSIPDSRIIKSKRLSLELVSTILKSAGPKLRTDSQFLAIIKQTLFVSLVANSVCPIAGIFSVSLVILEQLIRDFKTSLWTEIGTFIDEVFLCILESDNYSFVHKLRVLEIFQNTLCGDCKSALELFQLFDCSMEKRNVFELCVFAMSKIVQKKKSTNEQESLLREAALFALVTLVDSTWAWIGGIEGPPSDSPAEEQPPPVNPKQRKQLLERGIELFNSKPAKGIAYLIEHEFVSHDAEQVAQFFRSNSKSLNKTAIGEFLGENSPFNLGVFYSFVNTFDLRDLDLDVALRRFLSNFRLPGEAQKIDRIMEKFAEKYTRENPQKYPSADSAYVLAFAMIMLNTDLHSAQIKRKMTIEEFVKLGKGINAEIEISQTELARLYRNIEAEPISLREDGESVQLKKFDQFVKETEQMMERVLGASRLKIARVAAPSVVLVTDVLQMFTILVVPIRDAFGSVPPTERLIEATLKCCKIGMHFSSTEICFPMYNVLLDGCAVNVECVSAVLAIGAGNNIVVSDYPRVAKLISKIDKCVLVHFGGGGEPAATSGKYAKLWALVGGVAVSAATPQEILMAKDICENVNLGLVDVFINQSGNLSPVNLLSLVEALINESLNFELGENRLFCCQKIAEICDFNMGRIRIVWNKLWSIVSPYFVQIAQSSQYTHSVFAIDSLRQLALKFLTKNELENYHFQSDFLRPFFQISSSQTCPLAVQELVLQVTDSLIQTLPPTCLKSGWIPAFQILTIGARAFPSVVFRTIFFINSQIEGIKEEFFSDFFAILISLIESNCEEPATVWELIETNVRPDLAVFRGLARLVVNSRLEIREKSAGILMKSIENNAQIEIIHIFLRAVLTPLFDDITELLEPKAAIDILTLLSNSLQAIMDTQFDAIYVQFVPELIGLFSVLVESVENEKISLIGVAGLKRLVIMYYQRQPGNTAHWKFVTQSISRLMAATTPSDLMQSDLSITQLPFNATQMVNRCVSQLSLIQLVQELVSCMEESPQLDPACVTTLVQSLEASYEFALTFNGEVQLRDTLKQLGFMKDLRQLPGLLKQERNAVSCLIRLCFVVNSNARLHKHCSQVVSTYLTKEAQMHAQVTAEELEREISGLIPLVAGVVLGGISKMNKQQLKSNEAWIFELLVNLVASHNNTIRLAVQKLLQHFAPHI